MLTAHPRAYERTGNDQLADIPPSISVKRAFALDSARHLAFRGRYLRSLALPDRWVSWWLGATLTGLSIIRQFRPDILWTTYPIATANLIGISLQKFSGLPWVADLRDSMTEPGYPSDPTVRRMFEWIERKTVERAERVVFTARGARQMYAERYPHVVPGKWAVIPNGYDEKSFDLAEKNLADYPTARKSGDWSKIVLVHSGVLYPSERDPRCFFEALRELKNEKQLDATQLHVKLRATGHDALFENMISDYGIADIVTLEPAVSYQDALTEMLEVDGLLLFQASNCNHQIPAKLYEYMRSGTPMLALTDPAGDTAAVMSEAGMHTIVRLDDKDEIKVNLIEFVKMIRHRTAPLCSPEMVSSYSREAQTARLADLLDDLVS